ncbi:hypothetical protein E1A91_D02G268100v1 [Gossypium mustelinum]|uniref:Amino acid transporter transmembrane domain-containing protein n=1 Tax=Gossypium mustelinum TaxID=34275 RepID=A0A5D2W0K9_GOSMU|nr:hypothetical protein E1A91_D02G268100v1 [Gossypium mustelinum]
MGGVNEIGSNKAVSVATTPPISAPHSQFHSPSLSRSPLLASDDHIQPANKTPRISTPRFVTPLGSPIRRALQLTRLDPHDAWLPITESRNGNAYYAVFHTLCSGIGIQALVLPLYTLYLLVQLHESTETGMRYSRYMQLCSATFGEKLAKWLALFPIMYLSGGTCVALIIIGGQTCKMFFDPPTIVEWFLIFTSAAVLLSQLPNLNSIAGVSLIGAITAFGYCTLIWVVSVIEGRTEGVSYNPVRGSTEVTRIFDVFNTFGIVSFAFRGHNLILEIQATMPSDEKHPSSVPMWKGVKIAYTLVAMCLFPLAIGGYWAYGQRIPENGGMLTALFVFHGKDTSQFILGLTSLFVIINALSSFQIYGMPTFDDMESVYVKKKKKALPWWFRAILRAMFGYGCFFVAVAIPFLASLAGLVGGIALPVTLAYPCFMWLKVKKPTAFTPIWCLNWVLGLLGMALSGVLVAAGIYVIIDTGVEVSFFDPR